MPDHFLGGLSSSELLRSLRTLRQLWPSIYQGQKSHPVLLVSRRTSQNSNIKFMGLGFCDLFENHIRWVTLLNKPKPKAYAFRDSGFIGGFNACGGGCNWVCSQMSGRMRLERALGIDFVLVGISGCLVPIWNTTHAR